MELVYRRIVILERNHYIGNKQINLFIIIINIEKNYQYEVCTFIKLINMIGSGFHLRLSSANQTNESREVFYSRFLVMDHDWQKYCFITDIIKKPINNNAPYFLGIVTYELNYTGGEVYVDDISVKRINFRMSINNDRDEVFDTVNAVYQSILGNKEDFDLKDFNLIIKIRDNNKILKEEKISISSLFFTYPINIKKLKLKDNNFYQVEGIFKNEKENTTDILSYTFKKINKIKRNVTFDKYGRRFLNEELVFPLRIYTLSASEKDLMNINKTSLNIIKPSYPLTENQMDLIHSQGKLKVIHIL